MGSQHTYGEPSLVDPDHHSLSCSTRPMSFAARPVLHDHPVGDPPDVDERPCGGAADGLTEASNGMVDARCVPCSVKCCATRSPSPIR